MANSEEEEEPTSENAEEESADEPEESEPPQEPEEGDGSAEESEPSESGEEEGGDDGDPEGDEPEASDDDPESEDEPESDSEESEAEATAPEEREEEREEAESTDADEEEEEEEERETTSEPEEAEEPDWEGVEEEIEKAEQEEAEEEEAEEEEAEVPAAAASELTDRKETAKETLRQRRPDADEDHFEAILDEIDELDEDFDLDHLVDAAVIAVDAVVDLAEVRGQEAGYERGESGVAAFFDHPDELLKAARATRESPYEEFDAYSPFPIHGMDEAMGIGRSWMPWVTFGAGLVGFLSAVALEFGTMTFDWPMNIGGKPYAPWPAFVPVMFELTVLIGGVTTGIVMLRAAGCFEPADVIDPGITDDRFALWIGGDDPNYDRKEVLEFVRKMDPVEIQTFSEET